MHRDAQVKGEHEKRLKVYFASITRPNLRLDSGDVLRRLNTPRKAAPKLRRTVYRAKSTNLALLQPITVLSVLHDAVSFEETDKTGVLTYIILLRS